MQAQASYIIFTDGTTTYARNGTTGEIQFSGSNSSAVINNALGNTRGVVFVSKGNYTITSSIVMNTGNSLVGEGWETILNAGQNLNASVIVNYVVLYGGMANDRMQVSNLKINGANDTGLIINNTTVSKAKGIEWSNVFDSSITGVYVYDCGQDGISLFACGSTVIRDNTLYRNGYYANNTSNASQNFYACGLFVKDFNYSSNTYDLIITNNHAAWNGKDGINVYCARNVVISDNVAESNQEDGIYVAESICTTVVGNTVNHNGWNNVSYANGQVKGSDGITVQSCEQVTVSGNIAFQNGCYAYVNGKYWDQGDGIAMGKCLHTSVTGNSVSFNFGHGINLGGSNYTTVSGNVVWDNNCSRKYQNDSTYTADGIHMASWNLDNPPDLCWYNVITGNIVTDDQSPHGQGWGIAEADQGCNFTVIVSNTCIDNLRGGIKTNGTSSHVADSYNGLSWPQ
jgi:parallel beta-helix repeat protein